MGFTGWVVYAVSVGLVASSDNCFGTCPASTGFSTDEASFLAKHNELRQQHENTPCMTLASDLNTKAQVWADHMKEKDFWGHDPNANEGENLYSASQWPVDAWTADMISKHVEKAVQAWYDEIEFYDYATATQKSGFESKAVGHFTQVIWTDSVTLGLGISYKIDSSNKGQIYVVGRYLARGNFYFSGKKLEYYTARVQPKKTCSSTGAEAATSAPVVAPAATTASSSADTCVATTCTATQTGFAPNEQTFLVKHNEYRVKHADTPCMTLSTSLNTDAQGWADHMKNNNYWGHASGIAEGENLYSATKWPLDAWTPELIATHVGNAVKAWYDEIEFYDYATATQKVGSESKAIGHFTQLVWDGSLRLGLGISYSISSSNVGKIYVVGRYAPRGNVYFIGKKFEAYNEHVKPLLTCDAGETHTTIAPVADPTTEEIKTDAPKPTVPATKPAPTEKPAVVTQKQTLTTKAAEKPTTSTKPTETKTDKPQDNTVTTGKPVVDPKTDKPVVNPKTDKPETTMPAKDCSSDKKPIDGVINNDRQIKPFKSSDFCVQHANTDKIKTKLYWQPCASDSRNSNTFEFRKMKDQEYGEIRATGLVDRCWSILRPNRAWKQNIMLKRCKKDKRQMFMMEKGVIWLAPIAHDSSQAKYCVPFVANEKVRTRRCFNSQLGGRV